MLGLRSHIVRNSDIQKVSGWYAQVFEKKPYFQNENYIGFEVQGYEFGVFKDDREQQKNHTINIYWGVEDIQSEYERLKGIGAKPLCEPMNVGGDIMMGDFEDPFGNFFGIIYNPHFTLK